MERSNGPCSPAQHASHHAVPVDIADQIQRAQAQQHEQEQQNQNQPRQQLSAASNLFHRARQRLSKHFTARKSSEARSSRGLPWVPALRGLRRVFKRGNASGESSAGDGAVDEDSALSTVDERTEPASSAFDTLDVGPVTDFDAGKGEQSSRSVEDSLILLKISGIVAGGKYGTTPCSLSRSLSGSSYGADPTTEAVVPTAAVGRVTSAMPAICVSPDDHSSRAGPRPCEQAPAGCLQSGPSTTISPAEWLKSGSAPSRPMAAYSIGAGRNTRCRPSAHSSQVTLASCETLEGADRYTAYATSPDASEDERGGPSAGALCRADTLLVGRKQGSFPVRSSERAPPEGCVSPPQPAPSPPNTTEPVYRLQYQYPQYSGTLDPSRGKGSRLVVRNGIEDSDDN